MCLQGTAVAQKGSRPNIVLIVGDDIGFSDIGCYGSEIETPNLDKIANNGVRFGQFYNMAKCNPTRSSIFTGLYSGDDRAISFAHLLREAGYYNIHSGKEHFDNWVPERCFAVNNFDHTFTFFASTQYFIPPDSIFKYPYYLDGKRLSSRDLDKIETPFYQTNAITDLALKWLDEVPKDSPFFLYLPYHSAHFPLQALPQDILKYRDIYRQGWDKIRDSRFKKQNKLGIIPENSKLSEPMPNPRGFNPSGSNEDEMRQLMSIYTPWKDLSEKQQNDFSLEMAVFGAMVDRMDQNVGRLLKKLKEMDVEKNTLIIFFSDNGSCPFDVNRDLKIPPGGADSYRSLSTPWANLGNTPYKYYKQNGNEGGSHNHFIASWPDVITPHQFTMQPIHVVDIFPTILDIIKVQYPSIIEGERTIPLDGSSFLSVLKGEPREEPDFFISGFTEANRMYRRGDWKIVRVKNQPWELYNLYVDPTETNDLAQKMPEKLKSMIISYQEKKTRLDGKLKAKINPVYYPYKGDDKSLNAY